MDNCCRCVVISAMKAHATDTFSNDNITLIWRPQRSLTDHRYAFVRDVSIQSCSFVDTYHLSILLRSIPRTDWWNDTRSISLLASSFWMKLFIYVTIVCIHLHAFPHNTIGQNASIRSCRHVSTFNGQRFPLFGLWQHHALRQQGTANAVRRGDCCPSSTTSGPPTG